MNLIEGCALGVDLDIKKGDVVEGIVDYEEWVSVPLAPTPTTPRVCVVDLDFEAISFLKASLNCFFCLVP